MEEKNGDCGTYLHGWMCTRAYMNLAKFKPWLDVDNIAAELNECGNPVSFKVSNEHRELEDVVEKLANIESINPHFMWLHPLFVGINGGLYGWIVLAIDKVYETDAFGSDTVAIHTYDDGDKLLADICVD